MEAVSADDKLQILHLEDVATDAELVAHELRSHELDAEITRVTTREGFVEALSPKPDLILVDYALPSFTGVEALELAQEKCPHVPVVFVSGAIGEERAIDTLKQGATDYVLKDHLSRLGPAVRRALQEAEERRARVAAEEALRKAHAQLEQKVEERTAQLRETNAALQQEVEQRKEMANALRESEEQLTRTIDSAIDAIINVDEELRITLFNSSAEELFGVSNEEVRGRSVGPLLTDDLRARLQAFVQSYTQSEGDARSTGCCTGEYIGQHEEMEAFRRDGSTFPVEATFSVIELPRRDRFLLILRDVHDLKSAERELAHLQSEAQYLRQELKTEHPYDEIVGQSAAMQEVFTAIDKVASTDATVLVTGETGTGKELVARALHAHSPRSEKMLVKVNCAALSGDVIESELFGHERGAFTGAVEQRKGRFELADGGTLFLDEVGELPLDTQAKLLRALQEQEFERVGGTETISVDVRVVAATNRSLQQDVEEGRFRSDLFYRLNIFPIEVPPLRDRDGDVPLLVDHFCDKFAERFGKDVKGFSEEAKVRLSRYAWPGNVRELANLVERAVILVEEGCSIEAPDLGVILPSNGDSSSSGAFPTLQDVQRRHIVAALEETDGVVGGTNGAAALLDIKRTTLLARMDRLGIDPSGFR